MQLEIMRMRFKLIELRCDDHRRRC